MAVSSLIDALHVLVDQGRSLSDEEAEATMADILSGHTSPVLLSAFLIALRQKGESIPELVGFARAMRAAAVPVSLVSSGEPLLDTCGTGGDGMSTFNISTIAAFVVAGAGVRVAKHGNRSISSRCGSADLLEYLGIPPAQSAEQAARAIREVGIGFLLAPAFHPAMRHVQPVRRELKLRTVFNMLGPLTNPAGASVQLVGAFSAGSAELIARSLAVLGLERGFVVHGSDGLDEVTTTGSTTVFAIEGGEVYRRDCRPEDFGVARASPADLAGGDIESNGAIARAVLAGSPGPARDIVIVNAALALMAAGVAENPKTAAEIAADSIYSGAARRKLDLLVQFTAEAPLQPK